MSYMHTRGEAVASLSQEGYNLDAIEVYLDQLHQVSQIAYDEITEQSLYSPTDLDSVRKQFQSKG